MNWTAVAAVAEFLAAVGVLVSLIYLANQIKQNTRVGLSMARQGVSNLAVAGGAIFAANGDLTELLFRAFTGDPPDGPDGLRLQATCYMVMRQYENIQYQNDLGMLSEGEWQGFRENLKLFYRTELFRKYWPQEAHLFSPSFRRVVDAVIAETGLDDSRIVHMALPKDSGAAPAS